MLKIQLFKIEMSPNEESCLTGADISSHKNENHCPFVFNVVYFLPDEIIRHFFNW